METVLNAAQIGKYVGAGVTGSTVMRYLRESTTEYGRYVDHPFPTPFGMIGRAAYWLSDQVPDVVSWAAGRKGQGAGGGPKRKAATRNDSDTRV